ncbi:hypothetical protein H8959_001815 [Pygathrix nigripes]
MSKVGLRGGLSNRMAMKVLDPLRQALDSSMQSNNLCQHPQPLAFHVSAAVASTGTQASSLLGPLPHLSSFVFQPVHSLFSPLGSHGAEVFKKMVLRLRHKCWILFPKLYTSISPPEAFYPVSPWVFLTCNDPCCQPRNASFGYRETKTWRPRSLKVVLDRLCPLKLRYHAAGHHSHCWLYAGTHTPVLTASTCKSG